LNEKIILNQNVIGIPIVLGSLEQHPLLALLFATEQKYTSGAAMKSTIRPLLHKQARIVIGLYIKRAKVCRAFCHWLCQQFADGEPDREEGGLATL
jgi:hypothetical protein